MLTFWVNVTSFQSFPWSLMQFAVSAAQEGGFVPDSLKQLKQRVAELEAQRAALELDIQSYYRVIADQEGRSEPQGRAVTVAKAVVNEMVHILDAAGEPLHYREIYKRLRDRGLEVAGQDPLKNTGAHLSADQRFVSDGRGHWRLASWGTPKASADNPGVVLDAKPLLAELRAGPFDDLAIDEMLTNLGEMFRLSHLQREDLRIALAKQDRHEVRRLANQLANGNALPFLAEVNKLFEVFDGQRTA